MLALDQRRLFLNALKPPPGYEFDRGIGTTFTLDLTALLIAPLSLSLLDGIDSPTAIEDPVLLLEGLRRSAEKISIFCQAGRIAVPKRFNHLYRYLENRVVEVQAPRGGVFHPKIWLLRYTAEDVPTIYRLLCLTRNLTFDKSWDLMLQLEGTVADRRLAYGRNNPLGDFFQTLPTLATSKVSGGILEDISLLQDEVRRVNFRPPQDFDDDLSFHPLGIPGYQRGFLLARDYNRILVMSPFLQNSVLNKIASKGNDHVLISEIESLDSLESKTRAAFSQIFTIDSSIWDNEPEIDSDQLPSEEKMTVPEGLHAKLFVLDHGWDSTWFIGSANATRPGLSGSNERNVEFMVEMHGKRSRIGIEQVMGDSESDASLLNMLRPYNPGSEINPIDQETLRAERLADDVRKWLIDSKLGITVLRKDQNTYEMTLAAAVRKTLPTGAFSIQCWPVSLPEGHHQDLDIRARQVIFGDLSVLALTPFIAFEVTAHITDKEHHIRFALQLPITGLPENRDDHIIRAVIADKAQFLRFLRLILAQDPDQLWQDRAWENILSKTSEINPSGFDDMPLLEELIRAFSRTPEKIDQINQIVERLKRTPEGQQVLPDGFEAVWSQILKAQRDR